MTKGESPNLLLEELCIILTDLGDISATTENVQACSLLEDMNYALTWYAFNVRRTASTLASLGSVVSFDEDKYRMQSDFLRLSEKTSSKDNRILDDLEELHSLLEPKITTTFAAYRNVIESNKAFNTLWHEAFGYWNLATDTLKQAREIRNGGAKV